MLLMLVVHSIERETAGVAIGTADNAVSLSPSASLTHRLAAYTLKW